MNYRPNIKSALILVLQIKISWSPYRANYLSIVYNCLSPVMEVFRDQHGDHVFIKSEIFTNLHGPYRQM